MDDGGDTESTGHNKRSSVCEGNEKRQCEVVKESGDGGRLKGKGEEESERSAEPLPY